MIISALQSRCISASVTWTVGKRRGLAFFYIILFAFLFSMKLQLLKDFKVIALITFFPLCGQNHYLIWLALHGDEHLQTSQRVLSACCMVRKSKAHNPQLWRLWVLWEVWQSSSVKIQDFSIPLKILLLVQCWDKSRDLGPFFAKINILKMLHWNYWNIMCS